MRRYKNRMQIFSTAASGSRLQKMLNISRFSRQNGGHMASWMVHFRIADALLDVREELSQAEFVFGNIAPDSGVPNADWSAFTPSGDISHFKTTDKDGFKDIHIDEYCQAYLRAEQYEDYTPRQRSFYLGYLTHLLTDIEWTQRVVRPSSEKFRELYERDKNEWIWTLKKDWYDLDFLFLREHPDFRAFCLYESAVGFQNDFLDFFAPDAFDNRREYICGFYRGGREGLDREYPYLTAQEMECFVEECTKKLAGELNKYRL